VFGASQGAYADKLPAKWAELLPLPEGLTFDEGAGGFHVVYLRYTDYDRQPGLYLTWPTSYEALVGRAELKTGR
jgi:NADPH2:quinone reductase